MIFSLLALFFEPQNFLSGLMSGASNVTKLCFELCSIYSVWMGLLQILQDSGLGKTLAKKLTPLIKRLFKTNNAQATQHIAISLCANFFGFGSAAVPSAIMAMHHLDDKSGKPNYSMTMFLVVSCCSIQLIPTTVIAMRAQAGSTSASDIVLPVLIVSVLTTLLGIFLVRLTNIRRKKHD